MLHVKEEPAEKDVQEHEGIAVGDRVRVTLDWLTRLRVGHVDTSAFEGVGDVKTITLGSAGWDSFEVHFGDVRKHFSHGQLERVT
jgi:hypothetical protein